MRGMIEPVSIPDIYADDLGTVELLGPNVRQYYFVWSEGQKVVVAKIVRPLVTIDAGQLIRMVQAETLALRASGLTPMHLH